MFDIEKMRQRGISEESIKIMEGVNENNRKREGCTGHDFERVNIGRYRCKACGYVAGVEYVLGYQDGRRHAEGEKANEQK